MSACYAGGLAGIWDGSKLSFLLEGVMGEPRKENLVVDLLRGRVSHFRVFFFFFFFFAGPISPQKCFNSRVDIPQVTWYFTFYMCVGSLLCHRFFGQDKV